MSVLDFSRLPGYELQFHVQQLASQYVECIDDDRLEEWPAFFTEQCLYEVMSRENEDRGLASAAIHCDSRGMLHDRVVALRHANIYAKHQYRHLVSNLVVHAVTATGVALQSNYAVLQTLVNGDTHIYSAGRYLDRVVSTPEGLKFAQRRVIFDTYRIPNLMVTPL